MEIYKTPDLILTLDRKGADRYTKISYPLKYGTYSELETRDMILQFNLNHEIIRAKGKTRAWIHPSEWLKRSIGNDWIYYSTGGYTGVFESIGEYYLPNFQYPTNALIGGKPFREPGVKAVVDHWYDRIREIASSGVNLQEPCRNFLTKVLANPPETLEQKARSLFSISGGRLTVLPPDARHVDYDIIPLTISEGCLYKCRFCRVKTDRPFKTLDREAIDTQIQALCRLYDRDITNYSSVFLGEHDALNADPDILVYAAEQAHLHFRLSRSNVGPESLFLFGSVDSLLNADPNLFKRLNALPYTTYINIGLESADQETLDLIGKPITQAKVLQAFDAIQTINETWNSIEVTANFIMDEKLPAGHYPSFLGLVRDRLERPRPKGTLYLSPLRINSPSREVLFEFNRLKNLSRLPTFLYIIQRL